MSVLTSSGVAVETAVQGDCIKMVLLRYSCCASVFGFCMVQVPEG